MGEFSNRVYNKLFFSLNIGPVAWVTTMSTRFFASIKGVRYGKGLKTIGRVYFFRAPDSSIEIGDHCHFRSIRRSNLIGINHYCMISTHRRDARLTIGSHCGFSGVTIGCQKRIVIGNHCLIGANVIITDTDWHALPPGERRTGTPQAKDTIIHDHVFIGVNSIILKGSEIGENSVIGAGSVVNGRIPAGVIAAGNPCKVIKPL